MRNLKVISICLVSLSLGVVITLFLSFQLTNDKAYAMLDNNNNIDETIKKSCPAYEGNNKNIRDLVTNTIKSCLSNNNQPPLTNPNSGPLDMNAVDFTGQGIGEFVNAKVVITDNTTQKSNSYDITGGSLVQDEFVIPIGDTYTVSVISGDPSMQPDITLNLNDCGAGPCVAVMDNANLDIGVDIQSNE